MAYQEEDASGKETCVNVCLNVNIGLSDERARTLLEVLQELDQRCGSLPGQQMSDVLHEAVLACGFEDEVEAWDALMWHLGKKLDESMARGLSDH